MPASGDTSNRNSLLDIGEDSDSDIEPDAEHPSTGSVPLPTGSNENDAESHEGGSSIDPTLLAASVRTKRPRDDDISQFTDSLARRFKLSKTQHSELNEVASLSEKGVMLYVAAQLTSVENKLQKIDPANAKWDIPESLIRKIDVWSYILLLSPQLDTYVGDPATGRLLAILASNPSWGYTTEVRADDYKHQKVRHRAQTRLTDRRSSIKSCILYSLGPELWEKLSVEKTLSKDEKKSMRKPVKLNLLELCTEITQINKAHAARITIFMCARVAFLRHQLRTMFENDLMGNYWLTWVDAMLKDMRAMHKTKEARSKCFKKALKSDQKIFGAVDLQPLNETTPTTEQELGDKAAEVSADHPTSMQSLSMTNAVLFA